MYERQVLLKDAPYEFLPLLDKCKKEKYISHNKVEKHTYNGKLRLRLTVKSPLHIGDLYQEFDNEGNVKKRQMQRNGVIVIPGSSLKGAVRSVAEAVSYSCAVNVPDPVLKDILPKGNRERCSPNDKELCITCSTFGTIGNGSYKGKVNFGEFVLKEGKIIMLELPSMESPFKNYPDYRRNKDLLPTKFQKWNSHCNYGNERLYYCQACEKNDCQNCRKEDYFRHIEQAGNGRELKFRGRKFYSTQREKDAKVNVKNNSEEQTSYEMIKPESILEGEVIFQNLREEEGRLLAYALNIGGHFNMKLGYGKPYGYGKVEVTLMDVENMGSGYLSGEKASKDLVERWAEEYRDMTESKETLEMFEQMMSCR